MASSDETPAPMPPGVDGSIPPGKPMTVGHHIIDKSAQMMQSLKPINKMTQHVCTFAFYSHDMSRCLQTHHFVTRLNQDFCQCAVYDSDDSSGRLIGVEYIISDKIFQTLAPEEQMLWHSHAFEITSGLWVNPRVPEMIQKPELKEMAQTYGKFWCTWQVDRGDRLPLGAPALMVSPQMGLEVKAELVKKRDEKYKISCDGLCNSRMDMSVPEATVPNYADYWIGSGKGFAIDVESTEMKTRATFP